MVHQVEAYPNSLDHNLSNLIILKHFRQLIHLADSAFLCVLFGQVLTKPADHLDRFWSANYLDQRSSLARELPLVCHTIGSTSETACRPSIWVFVTQSYLNLGFVAQFYLNLSFYYAILSQSGFLLRNFISIWGFVMQFYIR